MQSVDLNCMINYCKNRDALFFYSSLPYFVPLYLSTCLLFGLISVFICLSHISVTIVPLFSLILSHLSASPYVFRFGISKILILWISMSVLSLFHFSSVYLFHLSLHFTLLDSLLPLLPLTTSIC